MLSNISGCDDSFYLPSLYVDKLTWNEVGSPTSTPQQTVVNELDEVIEKLEAISYDDFGAFHSLYDTIESRMDEMSDDQKKRLATTFRSRIAHLENK